jgi:hypothetical protein
MNYNDMMELLHPHAWVSKCFYAIGFIDGWSCTLLIMGAILGMFLKPCPRPFSVAVEILAIVLLVASTFVAGAYVTELWVALFGGNKFERWVFFHARGGMTSFVSYTLRLVCLLLPQCFWIPRFRRNMLAVLLIAVGASLPQWYERWVLWITH